MHQTRSEILNEWPVARKGTKYIAVANHAKSKSISLLYIIRDMLKLAKTRKETKYLLIGGDVKVNNRVRKDESFPVQVFGTVIFGKTNKAYRLVIESGKFHLKEISEKEAETKTVKIIGKKMKGKNIQVNLEDGQNFLIKDKFSLGDSAVVNTKESKVEKILPLKEGSKVEIVSGKYPGQKGKIKSIKLLEREKMYLIQLKEKEVFLPLKTFIVIE